MNIVVTGALRLDKGSNVNVYRQYYWILKSLEILNARLCQAFFNILQKNIIPTILHVNMLLFCFCLYVHNRLCIYKSCLTLCQLITYANILDPDQAWSGSELFDTPM